MSTIKSLSVNWMTGWANDPTFVVETVESNPKTWPSNNRAVWKLFVPGIHVATEFDSLLVPYFYSNGKPTEGFAGRIMQGTFVNGSEFKYKGGWSSRAACVNACLPRSIVDVTLNKYTAMAVWADKLIEFASSMSERDFGLAWVDCGDEAEILMPIRLDGTLKNPDRNKIVEVIL